MSDDPNSFAAIIAEWGKPADLARALGHTDGGNLVRQWRRRGSIPQEWWPAIIDAARTANIRMDAERLLRAQRNAVAGRDGDAHAGDVTHGGAPLRASAPERPVSGYDAGTLDALERQAAAIKGVFAAKGFEPVEPHTVQPADVFLDLLGEEIRGRTYVFTDPGGAELCLRPDITIPACRMYLARNPEAGSEARYCYNGPAFRYQPAGSSKPVEFIQAGVEHIGGPDTPEADAEIVAIALEAVRTAGLKDFQIKLGDLGLFAALVDKLDLPPSWRVRLKRHLWRPAYFDEMLTRLTSAEEGAGPGNQSLLSALDVLDPDHARGVVQDVLALAGISAVGGRSVTEISERFLEQAAEAARAVLPQETADAIRAFLAITAPCEGAVESIRKVAQQAGVSLDDELDRIQRRFDIICSDGLARDAVTFDADFGRQAEYYTGFVFELRVPELGASEQIAGGGRYDNLMERLGSPRHVPAVGCAIRTERLLAAVSLGGAS